MYGEKGSECVSRGRRSWETLVGFGVHSVSLSLSLSGVEEERLTTELRDKLTKACKKERVSSFLEGFEFDGNDI